jgi:shikimate kinase
MHSQSGGEPADPGGSPLRVIPDSDLVLIGMMGTGKTTVGRILATRLGWGFWDNDEALQRATGRTAAELKRSRGEAVLHAVEDRLLSEALQSHTQTVFAAAASVVLNPAVLAGALTVWLRASAGWEEQNIARSGQHHRPLPEDATAVLRHLRAVREPMYAKAADITIDVAPDATTTCARVMEALVKHIT